MVGGGIVKGGGTPMSFALVFKFPSPTVRKIPLKGGTFWGVKFRFYFVLFLGFCKWLDRVSHPILSQKMVRHHQSREKNGFFLDKWLKIRKCGFEANDQLF